MIAFAFVYFGEKLFTIIPIFFSSFL